MGASIFKEEKYTIRPIRRKGSWLESITSNHVGIFLHDGAKYTLCVPLNKKTNKCVDPLEIAGYSAIQRAQFAKKFSLKEDDLNVNNPSNFWIDKEVVLRKEVDTVDLSTDDGLLDWLILNANRALIAPSWQERFDSGEYKYALVSENEDIKVKSASMETKKRAWILYGKIEGAVESMVDFMNVYYLDKKSTPNINKNASIDWLRTQIGDIIEKDAAGFVEILDDDDYYTKIVIYKATKKGLLTISKSKYFLEGADTPIGTYRQTLEFFKDKRNQEELLILKEKVSVDE